MMGSVVDVALVVVVVVPERVMSQIMGDELLEQIHTSPPRRVKRRDKTLRGRSH